MSKITIMRTRQNMPSEKSLDAARELIFGTLDGFSRDDKSAWRRFWKRLLRLEPGEMAVVETVFPRSGPFHRRHMKIEQTVFDAQERFDDFDHEFRDWLKIGAGWVKWVPGAKGGIVPLPKSISYARADEEEFRRYHDQVIEFLRGPHASKYLWPHLKDKAPEMMASLLEGFGE